MITAAEARAGLEGRLDSDGGMREAYENRIDLDVRQAIARHEDTAHSEVFYDDKKMVIRILKKGGYGYKFGKMDRKYRTVRVEIYF